MDNLVTANILKRPVRALVCAFGVALGVALVMLFTGLARGMSNDLERRSSNVQAQLIFTRPGSQQLTGSTANLSTAYVERLREIEGVEGVVPVIVHVLQSNRGFGFERIEGVDWAAYAEMNNMRMVAGRAPEKLDEVVVDEIKAHDNRARVGDSLNLFGDQPSRVVGIYAPESGARVKMTLAAMQDRLQVEGKCTFIMVKCRDGQEEPRAVARRIDEALPGNKIQLTSETLVNIERSVPFLGTFLRVLVGLSAVVSTIVVMLAMYTTITERTREIGILKALGADRRFIVLTIETEALLISIVGSLIGFIIAFTVGYSIHKIYGLIFEYSLLWAATALGIGLLGGVLGALYPAVRASSLDPVNALSYD